MFAGSLHIYYLITNINYSFSNTVSNMTDNRSHPHKNLRPFTFKELPTGGVLF